MSVAQPLIACSPIWSLSTTGVLPAVKDGGSFTGATVIVTVAESLRPESSDTVYSKVSVPKALAGGS